MSSPEETYALHVKCVEAKIAAIVEPYQKAGINTENCTLKGMINRILPQDFVKIHKFLHYLIREQIFPQLMSQAYEKGIISRANVLNPGDICDKNEWLRTEGRAVIKEEFDVRKSKRKAAKRLQNKMSYVGEELKRKIVNVIDEVVRNEVKRAKMLETEGTSS